MLEVKAGRMVRQAGTETRTCKVQNRKDEGKENSNGRITGKNAG
jgi:hypothetical protein